MKTNNKVCLDILIFIDLNDEYKYILQWLCDNDIEYSHV